MKPSAIYNEQVNSHFIEDNPQQRDVLSVLDVVFSNLVQRQKVLLPDL